MKAIITFILFAFTLMGVNAEGLNNRQEIIHWMRGHNPSLTVMEAGKIVDNAYYYSTKRGLQLSYVLGVIRAESAYDYTASNSYGAKGLMQVVPRYHKDKIANRDVLSIPVNIEVGTKVLDECLKKHKNDAYDALSCYSGGARPKYHLKVALAQAAIKRLSDKPAKVVVASNKKAEPAKSNAARSRNKGQVVPNLDQPDNRDVPEKEKERQMQEQLKKIKSQIAANDKIYQLLLNLGLINS
jgi:soluble lytic murein transglycosylase-like protein